MFAQATIKLIGPVDHLRLVWQTGETVLGSVAFEEDSEATRYNVLLALQEMVTNVLRHGYQRDHSKPVEVAFEVTGDQLCVELRDQGPEFDPIAFERCGSGSAADGAAGFPAEAGGFGIMIARTVMDDVSYERRGDWNCLRMTKCVRVTAHT
ncbi:MAG: hypothetical protein CMJ88_05335 [Planctomycetes bacterium]|nr:hypothetical protein [Planctomycetota bacterium]